jgi:hypothetical protein
MQLQSQKKSEFRRRQQYRGVDRQDNPLADEDF